MVRIFMILTIFSSIAYAGDPPANPGMAGTGAYISDATPLTVSPGDIIFCDVYKSGSSTPFSLYIDPWPSTSQHLAEAAMITGFHYYDKKITLPSDYTGQWVFVTTSLTPEFQYENGWWIKVEGGAPPEWECVLTWPTPGGTITSTGPEWQLVTSVTGSPYPYVTNYKVTIKHETSSIYHEERITNDWGGGASWPPAVPGFLQITVDGAYFVDFEYELNGQYETLNAYTFNYLGSGSGWTVQIVSPSGVIEPMTEPWDLGVLENGVPPTTADLCKFHCELVSDPQTYTYEVTWSIKDLDGPIEWPKDIQPATVQGTYAMVLEYHDETEGWISLDMETFTVNENDPGGTENYWDQDEIDRLLGAAEGSKEDLGEIKDQLKDMFPEDIPEVKGDTGTGDPINGDTIGNGVGQKIPIIAWQDQPTISPYILSLPDTQGGNWNFELQIDPRGWDSMGKSELDSLNYWRQIIRAFLVVVLTIYLISKILKTLRQY